MKRTFVILAVVAICAMAANSQSGKAAPQAAPQASGSSVITVTLDGLACTTPAGTNTFPAQSWSFGASNTGTIGGGGGGAGRANVQDLSLLKMFDACSPALFGGVVTGKHFSKLTLVHSDGKEPLMTVTLSDVLITSYQLGGSQGSSVPTESISVNFAKISIADSDSGTGFCYDLAENKKC